MPPEAPSELSRRSAPLPLWQRAASLAARAHLHQTRDDGRTPYAAHPFRVAMTVRDVFGCDDPQALAIALLHDVIEDTTVDYDDLLEQFGATVADGVAALTKNKALREDEREREYDERLRRADWRARLVKLGDTFDNLSDERGADSGPAAFERLFKRCRRAIELAAKDESAHEGTRRAVERVRALMKHFGGE